MSAQLGFWFVIPDPDSFVSGGNHYNRELLRALGASGHDCTVLTPSAALVKRDARPDFCFVDTLHLGSVPALAVGGPVLLLAHYLPSLVGDRAPEEAGALAASRGAACPSTFMKSELARRGVPGFVAEPGQTGERAASLPAAELGVRAVLVANLVEAKGVLPLLSALDGELAPGDRFELCIVGSTSADPRYAQSCVRFAAERSSLQGRVTFTGALSHEQMLDRLQRGNLVVSASRMESYGMALAEARVLGLPIVARSGGHIAEHVRPEAGSEIVDSDSALARACVRLCRDPAQHALRLAAARTSAPSPRPWSRVAEELILGAQALCRA